MMGSKTRKAGGALTLPDLWWRLSDLCVSRGHTGTALRSVIFISRTEPGLRPRDHQLEWRKGLTALQQLCNILYTSSEARGRKWPKSLMLLDRGSELILIPGDPKCHHGSVKIGSIGSPGDMDPQAKFISLCVKQVCRPLRLSPWMSGKGYPRQLTDNPTQGPWLVKSHNGRKGQEEPLRRHSPSKTVNKDSVMCVQCLGLGPCWNA